MAYLLIGCTGQIYLLTVDKIINLPDKDLKDLKYFQLGHILFKLKDIILHNALGIKLTTQNISCT